MCVLYGYNRGEMNSTLINIRTKNNINTYVFGEKGPRASLIIECMIVKRTNVLHTYTNILL